SPITTITKSYITSIKNLIKNETTVDLQNAALVKKNYHQHFLFVREKNLHKYEKNYEILVEKKTINTLREERTKIETLQKKYNRSLKEVYLNTELVKTEEFLEKINSYSFSKKSLRKKVSTEHHTAQAGCCKVCSLYCCAFSFIFSLKVIEKLFPDLFPKK
ncbi:hypothetical protein KAH94_05555, partial [bacterium]|nr:hypothetical protein [bacterium]